MTWALDIPLGLIGLFGHAALWVATVNNVHATMMPRWLIKHLSFVALAICASLPVAYLVWYLGATSASATWSRWSMLPAPLAIYGAACVAIGLGPATWWLVRRLTARPPAVVRANHTTRHDIAAQLGRPPLDESANAWTRFFARLPQNEAFRVEVTEKTIEHPRLPPQLDGLSIAHLSDFHFLGEVGRPFYQEVVRLANSLEADLVAVTGDLVDAAEYIDWVPEILGQLRGRYGGFAILGNHDLKVKQHLNRLRRAVDASGLVYLGGRSQTASIGDIEVLLAGNELPWLPPAADPRHFPAEDERARRFRILLAHSPDQIEWARRNAFDLMLSGHNHGGQIRLPGIGPILAPSHYGVRFASGVFHLPPTVLHVSRGVSAQQPVRINCPPEVTRIVLACASSSSADTAAGLESRRPAYSEPA